MTALTRRKLLKQLMVLPIAAPPILSLLACNHHKASASTAHASLAPAHPHLCQDPQLAGPDNPGLNVFLHGLFVISIKHGQFDLYPPTVDDPNAHVYKAGRWKAELTLPANAAVSLDGIIPGTQPNFSSNEHFIIPGPAPSDTFDPTKSYFSSFQIPFPSTQSGVKLKRVLQKPQTPVHDFFCDGDVSCAGACDDLQMKPASVPLLYVFVFPQSQFANGNAGVQLSVADQAGHKTAIWNYAPDTSDPLSYDLHIHASPETCPDAKHVCHAIDCLSAMFNPPLSLKLFDPGGKVNPTCEEEQSLAERNPECQPKGNRGGEIANCMTFFLG